MEKGYKEEERMWSEELMIGDWVMIDPHLKEFYEFAGKPCQVIGLRDEDGAIKIDYDNGKYFWTDSEGDVLPVPLTAEILEKNGWKYEDTSKTSLILDVTKPLAGDGFECQWMRCYPDKMIVNFVTCTGTGTVVCKDVHKLQHLIKDIDFNKEIEL